MHIYIGLDLEDEVHSIWVIWTSGLHSWGRTIGRKDKANLEGHRSEGQVSGSDAQNSREQRMWWGPPATVTPDRARWGSFSVRRHF